MKLRDTQASTALDLLRATAAQAVCVGHAVGLFGIFKWSQPPHVPYLQNIAVLLFFLLSGFLIAYTLSTRSRDPSYGFRNYFLERFARIYSALIPSLIAIAVIDFIWLTVTSGTRTTYTPRDFLGSLLMLEDVAGPLNRLGFHSFGTAGQLWTLAIEWHIYMLAGALFFLRRSIWMPVMVVLFCTVPIAYLGRVKGQDFGHGVTSLWIAGFAAYYIFPYAVRLPMWFKAGVCVLSAAGFLVFVPPEFEFHLKSYPLLIAFFVSFVAVAASLKARPSRVIQFAAGYSFTLYLVHNTFAKAIFFIWPHADPHLSAFMAILGGNLLAIAIALPTEFRHREFGKWLKSLLPSPRKSHRGHSVEVHGSQV